MPVVIDQETINIRIVWLEMEMKKLQQKQAVADDEAMAELAAAIAKNMAKLEECNDWLRILNQDPGWGQLINVRGKKIPNLPTFKSEEELNVRLENPDRVLRDGAADLTYEETARAREYNARNRGEDSLEAMDGNGPFSVLEDRGLTEEEAVKLIGETGGNIGCPYQTLEPTPPSNDES